MEQPIYNCSQLGLYQCSRNILQSLTDNLALFTASKAKYTPIFTTGILAKVTAAELLQDFQARSAQSEVDYVNLSNQAVLCSNLWQKLKRYIVDAFAEDIQKPRLEEAGSFYYEKAIRKNWDSVKGLMLSGSGFITLHQVALEANLNMPTTFKPEFDAARTQFETLLLTFTQGAEEVKVGTGIKIAANNDIFTQIMKICLDGQQIFRNEGALKDQFTFTSVLEMVSGTGTSGFKGYVTNVVTADNIPGASIVTVPATKSALSDPDGYYELKQIPSGIYTISINCPGFQPFLIPSYQVNAGIMHNLPINLMPLPIPVE